MTYQLHHGDCLNILPMMDRDSIDSIVTDPPYGLGFMGKDWDHGVPGEHFWREAYRVSKSGAHLLAFGGTRTFHRLAVAIEDAGWEIRDTVMWVYGQGFPKSHDVSKAIDREAGAEREVIGQRIYADGSTGHFSDSSVYGDVIDGAQKYDTKPATPAATQWQGYGTALKPAWEPIIVARKPLVGTVAENVQRYGTGAMNINGCRIEIVDNVRFDAKQRRNNIGGGGYEPGISGRTIDTDIQTYKESGRWPANLIHDGSAEVLAGFPMTSSGALTAAQQIAGGFSGTKNCYGKAATGGTNEYTANAGSAARFFYCAKASKQDRDEGCEGLEERGFSLMDNRNRGGEKVENYHFKTGSGNERDVRGRNHHPTVKPTSLMRYLCRLVTPPQGVILDPFMGSGSTGKAAILEGFNFIGIDTEIEYVEIAARRIEHACEKVGIIVEQPMLIESRREVVDRPKQLVLI